MTDVPPNLRTNPEYDFAVYVRFQKGTLAKALLLVVGKEGRRASARTDRNCDVRRYLNGAIILLVPSDR